jgi:hypothetical protein
MAGGRCLPPGRTIDAAAAAALSHCRQHGATAASGNRMLSFRAANPI